MEKIKVQIDVNKKYQRWEGFGTSLMWWANAMKGFEQIPATVEGKENGYSNRYDELLHLLFDPEKGLGINIVRYNVGGGDCKDLDFISRSGARIPGYLEETGIYHWDADYMQLKVLQDSYGMIKETRQNFYNTVFSVSPPYFWTYSGSSTGSPDGREDNLRWDCYEQFVNYFLDVASFIQDKLQIPITDIEPVNEPTSGYWVYGSQKQEGCQFNRYPTPLKHQEYYDSSKDPYDPEKYSALNKIYEIAGKELADRQRQGSLRGVTITGTDETDIDEAILSFMALSDEAKACLSKISTHEYKGSKRLELKELASRYHKKLWMSEVSYGGGVWNPDAMDKGCFQLSRDIQKDLYEMGVTGWVAWQGIESLGENLLWNSNWGFIHCLYEEPVWKSDNEDDEAGKENFGMNPRQYCINARHCLTPEDIQKRGYKRGDFFLTKQYYVWGQYTKFIKENDYIIDVSDTNFVAAVSPQGDIVIVVTNEGEDAKEYHIDFPNVGEIISISGTRTSETEKWDVIDEEVHYGIGWIECTAAPKSVSTFQIRRL